MVEHFKEGREECSVVHSEGTRFLLEDGEVDLAIVKV